MEVNFGHVAKNYAQYRNDLPEKLVQYLSARGVEFKGKKVADLGAGTGVLTRTLFQAGADVVGIEPSIELIQEAKTIDDSENNQIKYLQAFSESIPLKDGQYDAITVLRAYHWFDREKTLNEINRILKPGGKLLVMDSGFTAGNQLVSITIQLIKALVPDFVLKPAGSKAETKQAINGFPVEWITEWQQYKFDLVEMYKFYYDVTFTNQEWCGRVGSLSWLTGLTSEKRQPILEELIKHLNLKYGDIQHTVKHHFTGCLLHRL